jgi:hypothetical protein
MIPSGIERLQTRQRFMGLVLGRFGEVEGEVGGEEGFDGVVGSEGTAGDGVDIRLVGSDFIVVVVSAIGDDEVTAGTYAGVVEVAQRDPATVGLLFGGRLLAEFALFADGTVRIHGDASWVRG